MAILKQSQMQQRLCKCQQQASIGAHCRLRLGSLAMQYCLRLMLADLASHIRQDMKWICKAYAWRLEGTSLYSVHGQLAGFRTVCEA